MRRHRITHRDYEGHGIYEFSGAPLGELPAIPDLTKIGETTLDEGGITVVALLFVEPTMAALNATTLVPTHEGPTLVIGTANVIAFQLGNNWASAYFDAGFAVLVDPQSMQTGQPLQVILTQDPSIIAQYAAPSIPGGNYVVVKSPPELLAQAKQILAQKPVVTTPPVVTTQPPVTTPPVTTPPVTPLTPPVTPPAVAAVGTPEWLWPAIVGAGVLALVALVASARR